MKSYFKKAPPKPSYKRSRTLFYWWRGFGTHKSLPAKTPILDRIENGDFSPSPYWNQARWEDEYAEQELNQVLAFRPNIENEEKREIRQKYIKRKNKLLKDAFADEDRRLESLTKALIKKFGGTKELLYECMENCDGDEEQLYYDYQKLIRSL